jgi:N-acylneuraminate cytidylyltransferase
MMRTYSVVALIPARLGSKRVPRKAIRILAGKPLIYWTVQAAKASGIFDRVVVCADSPMIIRDSEADHSWLRSSIRDDQPDIEWVNEYIELSRFDAFSILRPTSPFRTAETIRQAWATFIEKQPCDSLRAVERVKQTPYKMWKLFGTGDIRPLVSSWAGEIPWHDRPTQTHPETYIQNASLEIAWVRTVTQLKSISGGRVIPFFTEGYAGFDINAEDDWQQAEALVASGAVTLPSVAAQAPAVAALGSPDSGRPVAK